MKKYLYAYNTRSQSAKGLAQLLGVKRIKHNGSTFVPKSTRAVVNWGSSHLPFNTGLLGKLLNHPAKIKAVSNKFLAFQLLNEYCRMPQHTADISIARAWQADGYAVMARTLLTGHSGAGIVYCGVEDEIPPAPLYTKYVKKSSEFRVHLFAGTPNCFVQRKARKTGVDNPNWKVRNIAGGFVYASDPANIGEIPQDVFNQARAAFERSGLDFGAVDVIFNAHENQAYVLEINTAPGLQGRTLEYYKDTFNQMIG